MLFIQSTGNKEKYYQILSRINEILLLKAFNFEEGWKTE